MNYLLMNKNDIQKFYYNNVTEASKIRIGHEGEKDSYYWQIKVNARETAYLKVSEWDLYEKKEL